MVGKVKIVIASLVGAMCIQVAFIACFSSTEGSRSTGMDGGILAVFDAMVDAIAARIDASTPDATAAADAGKGGSITPLGTLDVANEDCTGTYDVGGGALVSNGKTYTYASHPYPGLTPAQLSQVRVIGHNASGTTSAPPGYEWTQNPVVAGLGPFISDGSVVAICSVSYLGLSGGSGPAPPPTAVTNTYFDSMTFTLAK